jgi:hypothetical protein
MKSSNIIVKKGIIFTTVIIFICGALTLGFPVICSAMGPGPGPGGPRGGHHEHNSDTSYVNVPILNNTGKTITITKMYISVPGECYEYDPGHGHGSPYQVGEIRVKDIYFGGTTGEPDGTIVFSTDSTYCSCKNTCNGYTSEFNENSNKYDFTGAKILCKIALDVNPAPSGTGANNEYTITYSFTIEGVEGLKSNTVTFNLP